MTVNAGAVVSATTLDVGEVAGSTGVVTITGSNSSINGSGRLVVGNQGTGNITMTEGGTLYADSALIGGLDRVCQ